MGIDVNSICLGRGGISINRQQNINKPEEIQILDDIALLIDLLAELNKIDVYKKDGKIDFKKLPISTAGSLKIATDCHEKNSGCEDLAINLFVMALERKTTAKDKKAIEKILSETREAQKKYNAAFAKNNPSLSQEARELYSSLELEAGQKAGQKVFLLDRAKAAVKETIKRRGLKLMLISPKAYDRLKLGEENWTELLREKEIDSVISESCKAGREEEKASESVPATREAASSRMTKEPATQKTGDKISFPSTGIAVEIFKKAWEKTNPTFSFDLRGGAGYHGMFGQSESRPPISHRGRAVVFGGASVRGRVLDHLHLQADQKSDISADPYPYNTQSNNDELRLSAYMTPIEQVPVLNRLSAYGMVGGKYYRNDNPSAENPNVNVLVERFRLSGQMLRADQPDELNLSLNFDQTLMAGWIDAEYPAHPAFGWGVPATTTVEETKGYAGSIKPTKIPASFYLKGGMSSKYHAAIAFAGVGGGYDAGNIAFGPYVGGGLEFKYFQTDFAVENRHNVETGSLNNFGRLNFHGRTFVDLYLASAGLHTYYTYDSRHLHKVNGELFGQIKFMQFVRFVPIIKRYLSEDKDVVIQGYLGAGLEPRWLTRPDRPEIYGGLMLRLGSLPFSQLSDLRPYSIIPLPEER